MDISTLTRDQIMEDEHGEQWIRKNRQKTDELSCIPLLDIPRKIAEKYENHPTIIAKGVVLPVISNQRMNSFLAEIATLAKVNKHLTTHIARHTFATVSLRNHVPLETISTLQNFRNDNILPYYKIGGQVIFDEAEIEAWLDTNYHPRY